MKPAGTRIAHTIVCIALLCAPALGQDDPAPPTPTPPAGEKEAPAKPDPAVKAERKVSPEGQKALDKIGAGLHLPYHYGLKTVEGTARGAIQLVGGDVTLTPKWSQKAGFGVSVVLPESAAQQLPPQMLEGIVPMVERLFRNTLGPLFLSPSEMAKDYDVGHKVKDDQEVVELLPYAETTEWERVLFYIDDDGLIEQMIGLPRIDYEKDPPSVHGLAGVEIEVTFAYEKKGERSIVSGVNVLLGAMGEIDAQVDYFELDEKRFVPSKATIQTPFQIEPVVFDFFDYQFDGKAVPATAEKAVTPSKTDAAGSDEGAGEKKDAGGAQGEDAGTDEGAKEK